MRCGYSQFSSKGEHMTQDEMQKVWDALREVYGSKLKAATLVVLIKDGDTSVSFETMHFPQQEKNT